MKKFKFYKYIAALCLAAMLAIFSSCDAEAAYVEDTANGVSYNDEASVYSGSAYEYDKGAYTFISIDLDNEGDRVMNVKVNKKGLLAKKTYERVYERTRNEYDYDTDTYTRETTYDYSSTYISLYGTKKGTYTVSFDVIDKTGAVKCTKKIKVKVDASVTYKVHPVKKITYAGKDIYSYYRYTNKTKGKLSVTLNKGYKLQSIEIGKIDAKGNVVYKKTKNKKNITLAKSAKYSKTEKYDYSDSSFKYTYNKLFPETEIRITVKNKKTKEISVAYYTLRTLNKK